MGVAVVEEAHDARSRRALVNALIAYQVEARGEWELESLHQELYDEDPLEDGDDEVKISHPGGMRRPP